MLKCCGHCENFREATPTDYGRCEAAGDIMRDLDMPAVAYTHKCAGSRCRSWSPSTAAVDALLSEIFGSLGGGKYAS